MEKLRTTVQEGVFQVSTKGIFSVQMGWEKEREEGVAKEGMREACAYVRLYMC